MTLEEFNRRNNWTYKDGITPPCNCCQIKSDECTQDIQPSDECRLWTIENTELLNAARIKFGQYMKLGYPCLRANLWLLGLPHEGVTE